MRLRNPFTQKIARHTSVAKLFRMPENGSGAVQRVPSRRPAETGVQQPMVVAALLPPEVLRTLPTGRLAAGPPSPGTFSTGEAPLEDEIAGRVRQAEQPALQPEPPGSLAASKASTAAAAHSPAARPSMPVQRQQAPAPPAANPPAAETRPAQAAPPASLEQDWPRLQRILRRHQESEESSAAPGQAEESGPERPAAANLTVQPPLQRQAAQPEPGRLPRPVITEVGPQPAQPTAEESQPSGEEVQLQPQTLETSLPAQQPSTPDALPLAVQAAAPESALPQPEPNPDASAQLTVIASGAVRPVQREPARAGQPAAPAAHTGRSPGKPETRHQAAAPAEPGSASVPEEGASARPGPAPRAAPPTGDTEAPSYPDEQVFPLEAAWPVQRVESTSPPPDLGHAQKGGTPAAEDEVLETRTFEQVHEVLASIAVEQPTDSHVEVITPRRPRPKPSTGAGVLQPKTVPPAETGGLRAAEPFSDVSVQPAPTVSEPLVEQQTPVDWAALAPSQVQTAASHSAPAAPRGDTSPGAPASAINEPDVGSIQRQPEIADQIPAAETDEPAWVDTEIGPLPADLWRLVGESPPSAHTQPEINSAEPAVGPARLPAVQRSLSTQPPAVVMRAPEEPAQAPAGEAPTGQTPGSESQAQPGQENQVNTDELAQKVYSYLKRKLMVEWERFRKRT